MSDRTYAQVIVYDSYGNAQWTAREVTAALAKHGPGDALHRALGSAHDDAIGAALDRIRAELDARAAAGLAALDAIS